MSVVSSTGLGSGMDINGIVQQLITAERQPQLDAITKQETSTKASLSGLGSLKSALSSFQAAVRKLKDGSLYKATQAVSSDTAIFTTTAQAGAVPGKHTVEVTSLAKAQQLTTNAEYSGLGAVASANGGTLNFTYAAGSTKTAFSVTVAAGATLANVRDAINSATGNNGVTASVINVDHTSTGPLDPLNGTTVSKLVLTSKDTGTVNGFSVAAATTDAAGTGLDLFATSAPANYSSVTAADAQIKVDGQTATRSSNTITDVLPGVTLNLLQPTAVGTTVNLDVSLDTATINKTITDFVTAYNSLHTTTNSLGSYGGSAAGATNGPLLGDSLLRNITHSIRQNTTDPVTSATSNYNSLAMIGITIDKSGVMSLDSTKLNNALTANLSAVSDVFTSTSGVAVRLDDKLSVYLQSGGALDSRQTSLNKTLASFDDQKTNLQLRMDNLQKGLQKQFIAMDLAVGQFRQTATFLTQKFG